MFWKVKINKQGIEVKILIDGKQHHWKALFTFGKKNKRIMSKTVLITGASRGIGRETAFKLAVDYHYQVIALSRNKVQLQSLTEEAMQAGGKIIPLTFDLQNEDFSRVIELLQEHQMQSIDILINNAGFLVNKPFQEIKYTDLLRSFSVNVFSPYFLIQHLMPYLENGAPAHVVNISSMGGFQGASKFAGLSAYSSSKAALACITECLAEEFKKTNIRFNCLCLGAVQTDMFADAFPGAEAPVTASEMASFIARFSDEANLFMNGKIIPVASAAP